MKIKVNGRFEIEVDVDQFLNNGLTFDLLIDKLIRETSSTTHVEVGARLRRLEQFRRRHPLTPPEESPFHPVTGTPPPPAFRGKAPEVAWMPPEDDELKSAVESAQVYRRPAKRAATRRSLGRKKP